MHRKMQFVFVLVFTIFLLQPSCLAARGKNRHSDSPGAPSPVVVPVRILRGYLVVAQGSVAGRPAQNFVIDIGTSPTMRSFQKKEMTPGEITAGGKRFGLRRALVMDDPEKAGSDFDGLLGVGAMGFAAASFDFASHTLYLEP
jgi:hypothetical protein